jgi:predicted HTH transcriptional regulator
MKKVLHILKIILLLFLLIGVAIKYFFTEDKVQKVINKKQTSKSNNKNSSSRKIKDSVHNNLTQRQIDLLNFITKNKEVDMARLRINFTNITERTIRRDLSKLQAIGSIIKLGSTKQAVYKII